MQIDDIPLMSMLKDRMSWLSKRQDVLSKNVANADVPGYTPQDLKPQSFDATLRSAISRSGSTTSLALTNPRHIAASATTASSRSLEYKDTPDVAAPAGGNSVSLESEMIKVAETQAQYQAAANIYAKAVTMMKVAIGRGGG
jgi:flagellar basal-body rod protein FlgB